MKEKSSLAYQLYLPLALCWQLGIFPLYFALYLLSPSFFWGLLILERPFHFFEAMHKFNTRLFSCLQTNHPKAAKLTLYLSCYRLCFLASAIFIDFYLFSALLLAELFDGIIYLGYRLVNHSYQKAKSS